MKHKITMPALSDTMSNGRLVRWLKRPGEAVKRGDVIAEVETDKALMDVEAFHDGYLSGPLAPTDAEYTVEQTIGFLADSPAEVEREGAGPAAAAPQAPAAPPPAPAVAPAPSGTASAPARASPYARSLAHQLGVDIGQGGTQARPLHAADIVGAASKPAAPDLDAGPPYRIEQNSSLREAVARTMVQSLATPTFRVGADLPIARLIAGAKARQLSVNVLLARAAALTIKEHPLFNAVYTPQGLARRDRIDVGVAIDMPEGLITPVLRDAGERPLEALMQDWRTLAEKATARRLVPAEYRGATFYVSDLGVFAVVSSFDSIIPAGASALLSVAAARGEVARFTLNCDHRVVFGGDAARFLQTFAKHLEDTDRLLA